MSQASRFAIVTPNRDRLPLLIAVMPSWQRAPQVAEIVVVDFGSRTPIRRADFACADKIRIVRVENTDCWRIGLAINLGVDTAAHDDILKLDSDIEIRDAAFLSGASLDNAFYRGRAGTAVSNGQTMFAKRHWLAVGGYNEWLNGYGFDDSDFYARLRRTGLSERYIDAGSLHEHPHSNETRAAADIAVEFPALSFPNADARLLYHLSRNTYLGILRRWSGDLRSRYEKRQDPDGTVVLRLESLSDEYRWTSALANTLAVVRLSGTRDNVNLLNTVVGRYLADTGGL